MNTAILCNIYDRAGKCPKHVGKSMTMCFHWAMMTDQHGSRDNHYKMAYNNLLGAFKYPET